MLYQRKCLKLNGKISEIQPTIIRLVVYLQNKTDEHKEDSLN